MFDYVSAYICIRAIQQGFFKVYSFILMDGIDSFSDI